MASETVGSLCRYCFQAVLINYIAKRPAACYTAGREYIQVEAESAGVIDMANIHERRLQAMARNYADSLSRHIVLRRFWDNLTLILKGSTARGYSDAYSDVDFVLFTDERTKEAIVDAYIREGLSERTDGVFLPLGDWDGHYNLDTYAHLRSAVEKGDVVSVWEYTHVQILHDPQGIYRRLLEEMLESFQSRLDSCIRQQYIDCQLQLDWMRQPLRRADAAAALLYGAAVWQSCCRLMYLLCGQAYPCDKWLFYYLEGLPLAESLKETVKGYAGAFAQLESLTADKELKDYRLYAHAQAMIDLLGSLLRDRYGDVPWIDEWYLYA